MNNRIVRFGMIKTVPKVYDPAFNLQVFEEMADRAHARGVQILLTCEGYLDGYVSNGKIESFDRDRFLACGVVRRDSAEINRVRELAKKYQMHMLFGFSELGDDGKIRNAALLIDDEGRDIGIYYKIIIYSHDELAFVPGDDIPVFDTKFGRFGILICADRRFPEHAAVLRQQGAIALLCPTYGMRHEKNEQWMRTRAYDNEFWVLFNHPTQCTIFDPAGDIAAKLESNVPDVLIHDIDLDVTPKGSKRTMRRPELYGALTQPNFFKMEG